MKVLILLVILAGCSPTRERFVVVNVNEYPAQTDSVAVVPVQDCEKEVKRQEKKKNFWRGATIVLLLLIVLDAYFLWPC